MKKLWAVLLLCLLLMPVGASADTFKFYYDSLLHPGLVSAEGTITAVPAGHFQEYLITAIAGERNGSSIASFVAGGPNPFYFKDTYDDNLLYMPSGALSSTSHSGFVFGTAQGEFNIWLNTADGKYYEYKLGGGEGNPGIQISFTADPPANSVPEASTLLLLCFGLIALAEFRRKYAPKTVL